MKSTLAGLGFVLLLAAPAAAKTLTAERFDTVVRVHRGGSMEVTETLVMRFEAGTFSELVRELYGRPNDGIEVLHVWMDGRRLAFGTNPGQAEVDGRRRPKVRWRFAPLSAATHTFTVRYLLAGAVHKDEAGDVLVWRAPIGEHRWPIESSTLRVDLPDGITAVPVVETRRTTAISSDAEPGIARVAAQGLRANGWTETTLRMPGGSVIASAPAWQERQREQARYATAWLTAGGFVFAAGLIVLFALRQGFDPPPRDLTSAALGPTPPDSLPPALAAAIVANGRSSLEHAAATLFALAARGEIRAEQSSHGVFGTRSFLIARGASRQPLAPHETTMLEIVFGKAEGTIPLGKARTRLVRHSGRFARAVRDEMTAAGLFDRDRQATRTSYLRVVTVSFLLAAASFGLWLLLVSVQGAWPLAVPIAFAGTALAALIAYGMSTPLSNEAARRAALWRGYQEHLKSVAHGKGSGASGATDLLPYAIAFGLAGEWSKYLKEHPAQAPSWFHPAGDAEAYTAFIATAGAGHTHSAHG